MHDGDRSKRIEALAAQILCATVLIGLVVLIYNLGRAYGYSGAQAQGYAAQYPSDTDKAIEACPIDGDSAAFRKCVSEAIAASHESQRSEYDLQAQRDMSQWAWWLLVVSIGQVPIGLIGLFYLVQSIRQGQSALIKSTEANEIASTAQRAWLKIEEASLFNIKLKNNPERPDVGDHFTATVRVKVRNVGNLPAKFVKHTPRLWLNVEHEVSFTDWQYGWMNALEDALEKVKISTQLGPILFPTDTEDFNHGISTSAFPVKGTFKVNREYPNRVRIFATIIILYQIGDGEWRYTLTNVYGVIGKIAEWVDPSNEPLYGTLRLKGSDLAT